jgi:hypothetical protein
MTEAEKDNLAMFLDGLTELSRRHRLGIGADLGSGRPVLFELEDDDFERTYSTDEASHLLYR